MPTDLTIYLCLAVGLSSALVAGVFQSFSDFVMRSLVAAKPEAGIEAMQLINRKVMRSVFLTTFLALAPLAIAFAVYASLSMAGAAAWWVVTGAAIYIVGVFLVTMLGNVPMNNRLDRVDASSREAETYWRTYGMAWTRWNHVRTVGSVLTSVCFLLAAVALA